MSTYEPRPTLAIVAHDVHDGGGMERVTAQLIRNVAASQRIVVISATLAPDLRSLVDWRRVPVPRRPFPLKFLAFFVFAGIRLRTVRADVVQTLGAIVPNRVDAAAIHFCHAGFVAATGRWNAAGLSAPNRVNRGLTHLLSLAAERWCYRAGRIRVLMAVSPGLADELRTHYPTVPVVVTPNGVDHDRFHPDTQARAELRSSFGIGEATTLVLFVGGDWDRKGLAVAIETVARTRAAGENVCLWVVGEGDTRRFRSIATRLGVGDDVEFLGRRHDPERFFAAADVFLFPSEYEAAPLVAYEAAASGLPIIATPVSGIGEIVGEGEAGFVAPRDARALSACLLEVARDPILRSRLGDRARARAASFTWERAASATLDAYGGIRTVMM